MTFSWSYTNTSGTNYSSVNDYFIVSCPSYSSSPYMSRRVSKHALNAGSSQNCSYTFTIPDSLFNTESGLIIKVGVLYQSSYLNIVEKTIKPISSKIINPLNYRSSPYVIPDRSFYLNETNVEEKFLFDEYRDYLECDEYNRLLFDNLSFAYSYQQALTYKSARIKFIDKESLFPFFNSDGDGYTSIPVTLLEKGGRVVIDIPNLTVNPLTLECNKSNADPKSKYLYVPKGKSKKLNDYEFVIEAEGLGINKTSFTHCLEVSISPFYIGDCEEADYCIIGGIKE